MRPERLISMFLFRLLGPLIERWVAGGRSREEMTPEERKRVGAAKQQARRMQKSLRVARRIGRL